MLASKGKDNPELRHLHTGNFVTLEKLIRSRVAEETRDAGDLSPSRGFNKRRHTVAKLDGLCSSQRFVNNAFNVIRWKDMIGIHTELSLTDTEVIRLKRES